MLDDWKGRDFDFDIANVHVAKQHQDTIQLILIGELSSEKNPVWLLAHKPEFSFSVVLNIFWV